jgi:hypothetical protein
LPLRVRAELAVEAGLGGDVDLVSPDVVAGLLGEELLRGVSLFGAEGLGHRPEARLGEVPDGLPDTRVIPGG